MSQESNKQDTLLDINQLPFEYIPEPKKEKGNGCRVSPSQLEILSNLYEKYRSTDGDMSFLRELGTLEDTKQEKAIENAHWSIYGTQMHSLTYFTQLFNRSAYYNRLPTKKDFKSTFPYRNDEYYDGLVKILDLTDLESTNISQSYWNEWRMNGQDFYPKKDTYYTVSPQTIKDLWENGTIPLEDIDKFNSNTVNIPTEKLNPEETLVINEVPSITNIFFNDSNLQVPTVIDEICIPKDFPKSPIQIIDYKTGKQFKEPEYKERVQIFLMMTSVLVNIIDKAHTVAFKVSDWDLVHNNREFPFFTKKNLKNNLIGSIYFDQLIDCMDAYNEGIRFSYVNPLTQERIDVDNRDIYLDTQESIKDMLMYLSRINKFYLKHKDILKSRLDSSKYLYRLPTFPIKGFDKENQNNREVQLGLI